MNPTECTETHWLSLLGRLVPLIKKDALTADFTLQQIADLCHRHKLLTWLLDGYEMVDVTLVEHFKMTEKSRASLAAFLLQRSMSACEGGGHRMVLADLGGERYRLQLIGPVNAGNATEYETVAQVSVSKGGEIAVLGRMTFDAAKVLQGWVKDQVKELRPPAAINASVDIETWGTAAGSAVSAIGAVKFTAAGIVGQAFYMRIDIRSCIDAGLKLDAETMVWWMGQDDDARKEVCKAGVSLRCALEAFGWWLCDGNGKDINVWGNGWDFDGGRLGDAYAAARMRLPWDYWQGRDLRTLEAEFPAVKDEPEGVAHNALDDARAQAKKILRIWAEKARLQKGAA